MFTDFHFLIYLLFYHSNAELLLSIHKYFCNSLPYQFVFLLPLKHFFDSCLILQWSFLFPTFIFVFFLPLVYIIAPLCIFSTVFLKYFKKKFKVFSLYFVLLLSVYL